MVHAIFQFPRGFMWGTATASHQVEGNNTNNNWSAWEQEEGRIIHSHKAGLACDWWGGRWREDFDRATTGGQNAHRLSIEWSRVQPAPDRWDEEALDRYRGMVRGLVERGLTPLVTLHHFTEPLWISELGSWENEGIIDYFVPYVQKVVEALREYVNMWVTINEPNVLSVSAYLIGNFPPGKKDLKTALRTMATMVRAHAAAFHAIHQIQPTARVSITQYYRGYAPTRSWLPLDRWVGNLQASLFNDFIPRALSTGLIHWPWGRQRVPEAKNTLDYLGIDYYTSDRVSFSPFVPGHLFGKRVFPPDADLSDTGMLANAPKGMFEALKWARQFKVPIIITENGIEDADDHLRPRYLTQHIHQVWRAVNFNFPIKGYFHWTLVDNFEWERGWSQRFGLWELDVDTQVRRKRTSADLYAEICSQNGLSSEMVAKYAPEVFEKIFPNDRMV